MHRLRESDETLEVAAGRQLGMKHKTQGDAPDACRMKQLYQAGSSFFCYHINKKNADGSSFLRIGTGEGMFYDTKMNKDGYILTILCTHMYDLGSGKVHTR